MKTKTKSLPKKLIEELNLLEVSYNHNFNRASRSPDNIEEVKKAHFQAGKLTALAEVLETFIKYGYR